MASRIMLAGLLIGQLADAATFMLGASIHGIGIEANGFAALAYRWQGLEGVMLLKGAAIVMTLALLAAASRRFPRLFTWGTAAATGLGLLGMLTNLLALRMLA
jgi:hypothetical protein